MTQLASNLALRRPDTVEATINRLFDKTGTLAEFPRLGPQWLPAENPSVRRLVVDDYVVYYEVFDSERRVWVHTVRHGRERPPQPQELE